MREAVGEAIVEEMDGAGVECCLPRKRGFTLVELLVAVAAVAVLALLARNGFHRYSGYAKSAEAKDTVGAIGRSAVAAGYRLSLHEQSQFGDEGEVRRPAGAEVPSVCGSSTSVPDSLIKVTGRRYHPSTTDGSDYLTGDDYEGWRCLRHEVGKPQRYQYRYERGGPPIALSPSSAGAGDDDASERQSPGSNEAQASDQGRWSAYARGDIDADGAHSWFVLLGATTSGGDVAIAGALVEVHGQE